MARGRQIVQGDEIEEFWALKNVSLEVSKGEVLGVIGRNGAGKSTLLKVLSRITEPTEGRVTLRGRVASLLEVGTGFHPELTGRENIFLNGAILGMTRVEIKSKFDEIVDFAGVEKFLDTPVKRFSSGMYVRLAFAVAAHLEPEVLVVDEVLAVGDAEFQKKCLGKMSEVSQTGRTVLFVSHNMGAVNRLCGRVLWLDRGQACQLGAASDVVSEYLSSGTNRTGERSWVAEECFPGNEKVQLRRLRLLDSKGEVTGNVDIRSPCDVEMEIEILAPVSNLRLSVRVLTDDGITVFTSSDQGKEWGNSSAPSPGRYNCRCRIPGDFLNERTYFLTVAADCPHVEVMFLEEQALGFRVDQTGGVSSRYGEQWPGVVCPKLEWTMARENRP